ncbi:arylsulfatase [Mediterranea massiliensis]|uniref:arylsulfatase n=1 Tax=Mediterranea massiliensis TaxID=1841865 RepID=UPI00320A9658
MRMKLSFPLLCSTTLLAGAWPAGAAFAQKQASSDKPNIIFILCDDMGYGDLACYGQKYIQTPNLDRMAAEGMLFTQAYAGSPVSAPSRATIMTGQHSGHGHVRGNKEYWRNVPLMKYGNNDEYTVVGQEPYDPDHIILPEIMKKNGYTTGMFGKWAGGYEGSCSTPDKRGIDEYYGFICQFQAHLYYPNFLNRYSKSKGDTATIRITMDENILYPMYGDDYKKRSQYSADLIHQEALAWLDKQDGKQPFYGFFTYTLPHAELAQPNDSILKGYKKKFFVDKTWGGSEGSRYNAVEHTHAEFAAMITRLDAYVGEIFAKLKEKGLDENTLVIFSSDNGPHEEGGADPAFFGRDGKLRGLKRQCYEGGIRIPFIVRWPGHVPAGTVNDHQLAFYDVMPTFCELIGDKKFPKKYLNKKLEGDCFDGISFAPTMLGQDDRQAKHDFLYWEFHETDQIGVRMGDWKLVVKQGKPHLYDLATDIHEDHDVAAQHPDVVKQMVEIIHREHRPSELFKVTLPAE